MFTFDERMILKERYKHIQPDSHPYDFIDFNMFTKNSFPEMHLWNEIRSRNIRLFPEFPVGNFFVDFGNPFTKIAVEVDSHTWHDVKKDRERQEKIESLGWKVFRIWATDILNASKEETPCRECYESGESPDDYPHLYGNWMGFCTFMDAVEIAVHPDRFERIPRYGTFRIDGLPQSNDWSHWIRTSI